MCLFSDASLINFLFLEPIIYFDEKFIYEFLFRFIEYYSILFFYGSFIRYLINLFIAIGVYVSVYRRLKFQSSYVIGAYRRLMNVAYYRLSLTIVAYRHSTLFIFRQRLNIYTSCFTFILQNKIKIGIN